MDSQLLRDMAKWCDGMAKAEVIGSATAQEKARQVSWNGMRDAYLAAADRADEEVIPEPPVDNAPTIMITSPADNATVSGSVNVITVTSDEDPSTLRGTASIDGQPSFDIPLGTWTWDTRIISNGPHNLVVKAIDVGGKIGSDEVFVTVSNNITPPAIRDGRDVNPQNTGWQHTGVTLSAYSGPMTVTTAGTVIEGKDINGSLTIDAANVVIKKSRVKGSGDYAFIGTSKATNLLVEDTEITAKTPGGADRAVWTQVACTFRRVLVRGTQRGFAPGDNMTMEEVYCGDNVNNTDNHTSALGAWGGMDNLTMKNCNFSTAPNTNASSACSFYPESAPNRNIRLDGCLFDTGGGYALYVGYTPPQEQQNVIHITNCWFGVRYNPNCGQHGPVSNAHDGLRVGGGSWTNNKWHAPGQAKDGTSVPLPS